MPSVTDWTTTPLAVADGPTVYSADNFYAEVAAEMVGLRQEQLRILLLNNKHQIIEHRILYTGTLTSSPVRPAEIFRPAILASAASVAMAHNHPSGDPTPSPEDVLVTRRIREAGELLDIELIDHVVIGRDSFVSMRQRRLGFDK